MTPDTPVRDDLEEITTPAAATEAALDDIFAEHAQAERQASRALRRSLYWAGALHAVLLLVTVPELYPSEVIAESEPDKVFVVRTPRFKKPEVPTTPPPRELRKRRVPMPDPTPDDPEPLYADEPEAVIQAPDIDAFPFAIPEAPPVPEPTGPVDAGTDVRRPERLTYVTPRYSEIARRARIQGPVILEAIIDTQGHIRDIKVLKPLPMGLAEEAVKAVQKWTYEPSTLNGKPVEVRCVVTVQFTLNN